MLESSTYSPEQRLPTQDVQKIIRLSQWFCRDAEGHAKWAETAKICQDFFEGRQWTPEQLAILKQNHRISLVINKIAPLVRLVSGYQRNNRTDITFLPCGDANAQEETATALNQIVKVESGNNDLPWTDSEVFLDGIITGRGYWDMRLNFEQNDLGENKVSTSDPFSIFVDADCDKYDIGSEAQRITEARWVSVEEIYECYGKEAGDLMRSRFTGVGGFLNGHLPVDYERDYGPIKMFGNYSEETFGNYRNYRDALYNEFIDTTHKKIRLIDVQYYRKELRRCFIDLETGDIQPIPNEWDDEKINKCLVYAQSLNNPLIVKMRPAKTVNWSVICGDIMLHDRRSPYETFTKIGFFPYFRRGFTRGIVEDLLDPQREINKKRSNIAEVLARNANSGWSYHENALDARNKEKLRQHGAEPGVNVQWKGDKEPKRLEPGGYPQGLDRLEEKAGNDLMAISGINESALGQLDRVQSGRAIEARQRQSVIALQPYLDNFSRSKKQQGRKFLEMIQNHYTEPRIYRLLGEDGNQVTLEINKKMLGADGKTIIARINDVTTGKYQVCVNETPMSATFQEAQFEEALMILQKLGPVGSTLLQVRPDLIIQMSSLPRKEEWTKALQQAMAAMQQQQEANLAAAGQPPMPADGAAHPVEQPQQPVM